RIPRDLGFYDLRSPDSLAEQIALAQSAGLKGFAFYYYNFDGERVLDLPLDLFMDLDHDFGFYLVWANENWTRTWDGQDRQVIKGQTYSAQALAGIASDIARHMRDPRYYRIGEQPLLVIYRPGIVPDAKRYLARLRKMIGAELGVEPLIFMAQGFGDEDPRVFALDGAIEFPPHKIGEKVEPINAHCKFYDDAFRGQVYAYDHFVEQARACPKPPYPLIRTVFPSWDNESRRPGFGMTVTGSSPAKYRRWLTDAVRYAKRNPIGGQSVVAINAWNEWCEGAYLEPDMHYGAAYLEETKRVIFQAGALPHGESIILVGHDAHKHGAQLLLRDIARQLKMFGHRVAILLLEGGPLEAEYRDLADYFAIAGGPGRMDRVLRDPALRDYRCAITNTVVAGAAVSDLKEHGIRVISLVHEMGTIIAERQLQSRCEAIARESDLVVFPAECVRESFMAAHPIDDGRWTITPQGIYNLPVAAPRPRPANREPVILNAGFGDLRKGYDLFVATATAFAEQGLPGRFVWVGDVEKGLDTWVKASGGNFQQIPFTKDIHPILETADLFLLTSREDPFPSVALEALSIGRPVVAFRDTGGIADFVAGDALLGGIVPQFSIPGVAREICTQLDLDDAPRRSGRVKLALGRFSFPRYVAQLVEELGFPKPSIGVVIPNYNYAGYLPSRVDSVLAQTNRPDQVFLLDDRSTDDSAAVIGDIAAAHRPFIATVFNEVNSGSPFVQWRAGAELCSTKYVWIAEADDLADAQFLEKTVAFMEEHGCDLCFTDSSQIDRDGTLLAKSYDYYLRTVDPTAFEKSFVMGGRDFLRRMLSQKNVILNVSSVLWKRAALLEALDAVQDDLKQFRVAGDWLLYAEMCRRGGRVGYIARALNVHRRHESSATHAQKRVEQLAEIRRLHETVRAMLGGDTEMVRRKQKLYEEELVRQFKLVPDDAGQRAPQRAS
ncbi:MAG: glycoside hydrolase family 99-like domain-containing protein, partial [Rhizobiales bacterium]|nr:glycoside hydrolase family 99-like domain-containing protein [Hyphomicrobiales bacterium]